MCVAVAGVGGGLEPERPPRGWPGRFLFSPAGKFWPFLASGRLSRGLTGWPSDIQIGHRLWLCSLGGGRRLALFPIRVTGCGTMPAAVTPAPDDTRLPAPLHQQQSTRTPGHQQQHAPIFIGSKKLCTIKHYKIRGF